MDLFSLPEEQAAAEAPLAARMRPRTLAEFVGQERIVGPGTVLRAAIERGQLFSMIFFGPPGSGKTTLARLIAPETGARFVQLSAVSSGTADVRAAIQGAREARALNAARTILFIDEIHRFNKAQQDALLPAIEDGIVTLIGATTENPYFEVNSALLSRCQLYRFEPLERQSSSSRWCRPRWPTPTAASAASASCSATAPSRSSPRSRAATRAWRSTPLETAWRSRARGDGAPSPSPSTTCATPSRSRRSPTTARTRTTTPSPPSSSRCAAATRTPPSTTGLACWPAARTRKFIARRMIVFASEDVGNADPQALAGGGRLPPGPCEFVGLPECRINLSQAALYLALAPKSNAAYKAVDAAMDDVRREGNQPPPPACAAPTTGARRNWAMARGTSTRTVTAAGWTSSTCRTSSQAAATTCRYVAWSAAWPSAWRPTSAHRGGGARRGRGGGR